MKRVLFSHICIKYPERRHVHNEERSPRAAWKKPIRDQRPLPLRYPCHAILVVHPALYAPAFDEHLGQSPSSFDLCRTLPPSTLDCFRGCHSCLCPPGYRHEVDSHDHCTFVVRVVEGVFRAKFGWYPAVFFCHKNQLLLLLFVSDFRVKIIYFVLVLFSAVCNSTARSMYDQACTAGTSQQPCSSRIKLPGPQKQTKILKKSSCRHGDGKGVL